MVATTPELHPQNPSLCLCPCTRAREILATPPPLMTHFATSPPPRRHQELRKEVRRILVPLVGVTVLRVALENSPSMRRRIFLPCRAQHHLHRVSAVRAALVSLATSRTSLQCKPRAKPSTQTLFRSYPTTPPPSPLPTTAASCSRGCHPSDLDPMD